MNRNVTQSILADLDASKADHERARQAFVRSFRGWLSDHMRAQGVSATALSQRLGCSETNIYRILRASNTTVSTIAGVAHALGFTAKLVFEPEATCPS